MLLHVSSRGCPQKLCNVVQKLTAGFKALSEPVGFSSKRQYTAVLRQCCRSSWLRPSMPYGNLHGFATASNALQNCLGAAMKADRMLNFSQQNITQATHTHRGPAKTYA
jgi:hypothetical protein